MDPALEVAAKTHLDERQTVCTSYVEFLPLAAIVPTWPDLVADHHWDASTIGQNSER